MGRERVDEDSNDVVKAPTPDIERLHKMQKRGSGERVKPAQVPIGIYGQCEVCDGFFDSTGKLLTDEYVRSDRAVPFRSHGEMEKMVTCEACDGVKKQNGYRD